MSLGATAPGRRHSGRLGFLALVLAYGLLIAVAMVVLADKLRAGAPWARTVTMVLQTLAFVSAVIGLANGRVDLNLLIAPAIVLTLAFDRQARAHFGLD